MWNLENKRYDYQRGKARPSNRKPIRHIICPKPRDRGPRNPPTRINKWALPVRSHLTNKEMVRKPVWGATPQKEASHHASLKEFGSLMDQGKWKLQQVNKYGSRASCPITTGSSRIFINKWAFDSKISIKRYKRRSPIINRNNGSKGS